MNTYINKFKINKRKFILAIFFLLLALFSTIQFDFFVSSNDGSILEELSMITNEFLGDLDVSAINELVENVESYDLFDKDIKKTLSDLINGKYFTDYTSFFGAILSLIFSAWSFEIITP